MASAAVTASKASVVITYRKTPYDASTNAAPALLWAGAPIPLRSHPGRIEPMAAKQISYADDARQRLLAGASKLARAVRSTLGPRGRNAVLDKGWGAPNVTKDGVTVA